MPLSRQSIQELQLENREEVSLYLELIRIIERDIDEINAVDTRTGWTTWAIVGGIVGAILLFLTETRRLESFPSKEVKTIALAALLFYDVTQQSFGAFKINAFEIRPGRIRWSNDAFFSYIPKSVFRFLVFLASVIVALSLELPIKTKTIIVTVFSMMTFGQIIPLVYSVMEFPLGNTKVTRKGAYIVYVALFPVSIIALLVLAPQLRFPIGEGTTVPYILAGLIVAATILRNV